MSKKLTKEEFILRAREVHGWKYDYSKVEYVNMITKVCIVCPEHGEFWQAPVDHLNRGHGCQNCNVKKKLTQNEIINRFKKVHGQKYNYEKVCYKNIITPVCIICSEHGEFWQTPQGHIKGNNCPKCAKANEISKKFLSQDDFIARANVIHNNKYCYEKTEYQSINKPVLITCPIHGDFLQTPHSHLKGCGCQKCRTSHLEKKIEKYLESRKIVYVYQFYPKFLMNKKSHQSLDFYLPDYHIAIECQGAQHYTEVAEWGGKNGLTHRIELDNNKLAQCKNNGIDIVYYSNKKYTQNIVTTYEELDIILKIKKL